MFRETNCSGYCDCGDSEYWDPKGNCSAHSGFVQEDTVLSDETKKRLTKVVGMLAYCMFQIIERALLFIESPRPADIPEPVFQKVSKAKIRQLSLGSALITNSLLQGIASIIEGVEDAGLPAYPQLGGVFGDILTTPLCTLCPGKPLMMFHRHDDYARPQPLSSEPQPCECTISQLILRYCTTIEQYVKDGELTKHLQVLIHNERFRLKFAVDFHNHLGFVFNYSGGPNKRSYKISDLTTIQYMLANSKSTANQIIASPLFTQGMQALEYLHDRLQDCEHEHQANRYQITEKMHYNVLELLHTPEMIEYVLQEQTLSQIVTSMIVRPQQSRMSFIPGMDFSQDNELLNQQMIQSRVDQFLKTNCLWRMFCFYKCLKYFRGPRIEKFLPPLLHKFSRSIQDSRQYHSDDSPSECSFYDILELLFVQVVFLSSCADHSG